MRVLPHPLRIGTRGSPMALRQTALVAGALAAAHPALAAPGTIEIVTIRTTGDGIQHRLLGEIGGKGLFAKEIEEVLVVGSIDLAVHSLKDLETWLPDGIAAPGAPRFRGMLPAPSRHLARPAPRNRGRANTSTR